MAKRTKAEEAEARERLLQSIKPGDTLFTVLRHVSPSGMTRDIDIFQIESTVAEPNVFWLSGLTATAAGFNRKGDAIRVSGAGMDMGYHLVYNLSRTLFPDGFGCIGEGCPSNDHSNGDRDYRPHILTDENGQPEDRDPMPGEIADGCIRHWHKDGGYALRHRWI